MSIFCYIKLRIFRDYPHGARVFLLLLERVEFALGIELRNYQNWNHSSNEICDLARVVVGQIDKDSVYATLIRSEAGFSWMGVTSNANDQLASGLGQSG
jgi:hypothetical protein